MKIDIDHNGDDVFIAWKTLSAALVLSVVGVLMMGSRLTSGSAALQERIFENKIPAHIPIKML